MQFLVDACVDVRVAEWLVPSVLASGAIIAIEDSRYQIRRLPIVRAEDAP